MPNPTSRNLPKQVVDAIRRTNGGNDEWAYDHQGKGENAGLGELGRIDATTLPLDIFVMAARYGVMVIAERCGAPIKADDPQRREKFSAAVQRRFKGFTEGEWGQESGTRGDPVLKEAREVIFDARRLTGEAKKAARKAMQTRAGLGTFCKAQGIDVEKVLVLAAGRVADRQRAREAARTDLDI